VLFRFKSAWLKAEWIRLLDSGGEIVLDQGIVENLACWFKISLATEIVLMHYLKIIVGTFFRYLLKNKANVLLKNKAGDLPIHLACQYAQQGHKYGESSFQKSWH